MKALNFEQIKKLVHGAARIEEGDGKLSFFRFTKEQQELYKSVSQDFYTKSFSTSGISIEFDTDSEILSFSVSVSRGSSRTYFTHSVFVNGKRIGELSGDIGNADNLRFKQYFKLGEGMKTVCILFPWSVASSLLSLELDDNAVFCPTKKNCNILMLGDSITQGYDASIPEISYAAQIARSLNAEARNKGIAGEQFFAKLTESGEDFKPDIITVAYGTNDWRHGTRERFERECRGFFTNLRKNYPDVKIVAVTPLWRVDIENRQEFGEPLCYVSEYIRTVCDSLSDVSVIDGIDLIPHNAEYYQTDGVHPIDAGFMHYGRNLLNELNKII